MAKFNKIIEEGEKNILKLLAETSAETMLDDVTLINTL